MAEKIQNINIDVSSRKKFTIDGDENRVLELNTNDMGIFSRLGDFDQTVTAAFQEFEDFQNTEMEKDDFDVVKLGEALKKLDDVIRNQFDILYDTNFSEVVVPHGTMIDLIDGDFRFQKLNDVFSTIYEKQFSKELKAQNEKIRKHTEKYIGKIDKTSKE
ncbi:MAG: hypothetical protein J6W84_06185 [Bacteroidales bacterium]|nr:hypothetical protein [Bacteroidales bacterium]